MAKEKALGITSPPSGSWVQTDRMAHEKWAVLGIQNPRAASLLHLMIAKMGRHNAIIASQKNLADLFKCSISTIKRSLSLLSDQNWIEVRRVGPTGTINAYIINDRVAWSGKRDGIRYSLFSATVLISDDEQPDKDIIGEQPPLERVLLDILPGELQIPTGPGLEPPSEPEITGLERDLPSRYLSDDDQIDTV